MTCSLSIRIMACLHIIPAETKACAAMSESQLVLTFSRWKETYELNEEKLI